MRWKSISFSNSFLHGRWRLTTEITIFTSLYHLFCGFQNAQMQPCICVLSKRCSSKFCQISTEKHVCWSLFLIKLSLQLNKNSKLLRITFLKDTGDCFRMLPTGKVLMITGWRYHFAAFRGFSFWMIAFTWTVSWDVEISSSDSLLKSEGNH